MPPSPCSACDGRPVVVTTPRPGASYKALGRGKGHKTGGPFRQYCGVCNGAGLVAAVAPVRGRDRDDAPRWLSDDAVVA